MINEKNVTVTMSLEQYEEMKEEISKLKESLNSVYDLFTVQGHKGLFIAKAEKHGLIELAQHAVNRSAICRFNISDVIVNDYIERIGW